MTQTYQSFRNVLQVFQCPISQEIMDEPTITSDGFSYERVNIAKWLQKGKISPMTGLPIQKKNLIPNFTCHHLMNRMQKLVAKCSANIECAHKEKRKAQRLNKLKTLRGGAQNCSDVPMNSDLSKKAEHFQAIKSLEILRLSFQKSHIKSVEYEKQLLSLQKKFPDLISVHFSLIGHFIDSKNLTKAQKYLHLMKQKFPDSLVPKYLEIEVLYAKGEKQQALSKYYSISSYSLLEEHTEIEIRALVYEINLLGNSRFNKTIIDGFSTLFPNNFFYLGWKICSYIERHELPKALTAIQVYLNNFGPDRQVLYNKAMVLGSLDKSEAVKSWTEYIELENCNYISTAYQKRGLLKAELNDSSFVDDLKKAKELDNSLQIEIKIACIYNKQNKLQQAEYWLENYFKDPNVELSIHGLELFAEIKEKNEKYAEAVALYRILLEANPLNAFKYYFHLNRMAFATNGSNFYLPQVQDMVE